MANQPHSAGPSPQPAGPPPTGPTTPIDPYEPSIDEQIRRRAQEIWERTGHPQGRDDIHWQIASDEILGH